MYEHGGIRSERALEMTARLTREVRIEPAALVIRGRGDRPAFITVADGRPRSLTVRSVSASAPWLRATLTAAAQISVSVADDAPDGEHRCHVAIVTDDPDYAEIKVPVTVIRPAKQRVTASPGRAVLPDGGSVLVQLRDTDGQPVEVASVQADGPFTTRWASGPGGLATLRIGADRTRPTQAGSVTVKLKSPAGQTVVIPVTVD
jgi:hypothetical protein